MESIRSRLLKFMAGMMLRSAYRSEIGVDTLRRGEAQLPTVRMATGCKIENRSVDDVLFSILTPEQQRSEQVLFYVHGGAWVSGPSGPQWQLLARLCRDTGRRGVLMNYRRAPEFTVNEGMADVLSVNRYVRDVMGADDIVFVGDSAGANLATGTFFKLLDDGQPLPSKLVLLSPCVDIRVDHPDTPIAEKNDPVMATAGLRDAGRKWAGDVDLAHPYVSPINGDLSQLPPTLMVTSNFDTFYPDCKAFYEKASAAGTSIPFLECDRMMHIWFMFASFVPEGEAALEATVAYING
ncbi:MAG: alpha/beta hydrolase [Chloroflexota bacterium]